MSFQENILKHSLLFVFFSRFRIYYVFFQLNYLYMFPKKQLLVDVELTMQCQSEPRKETKFICILNYAQSLTKGICKGGLKTL